MLPSPAKPDGPTRAQILALLRRGQMTVDRLAQAIGVTDNAVRMQLAASTASNGASLEQRVRAAAAVLEGLGGDTVVERQGNGSYVLRGFACPLSRSVAQCPPLCSAVEELVAGITHAKVQERCDRSE